MGYQQSYVVGDAGIYRQYQGTNDDGVPREGIYRQYGTTDEGLPRVEYNQNIAIVKNVSFHNNPTLLKCDRHGIVLNNVYSKLKGVKDFIPLGRKSAIFSTGEEVFS